ncbi:hypothetical protein RU97_GL000178 [Enterococcus canis]|uniref:Cardiolipin synthase N-terminal domain-containing protein n=2 Tax=Enterococcus canis TaxID=214095 RepID=A0A1L8RJR0_9ENTE|nr:PLDc N-terminal domain-containing protein [Enterococcus canis]OJG19945.1 hypothetical protein RU97_GL000178 [Enterococcus canis]
MSTQMFIEYLPFFIPLILLEVGLMIAAVIHVWKHPQYRFGNRPFWLVVVIVFQLIGPLLYFVVGRGEA